MKWTDPAACNHHFIKHPRWPDDVSCCTYCGARKLSPDLVAFLNGRRRQITPAAGAVVIPFRRIGPV
jgi:hypothetical protein